MNLKTLSDQALLESTRVAAKNERHFTTIVLHHLLEVYDRRLFGPKYPSLHEYAVDDLKYNDGEAQRRINAMWVLRAVPEIDQKIDSGSLSLTTLSQAQVFFRHEAKVDGPIGPEKKREVLAILENKSTRQVDRELISRAAEPLTLKKKDQVRAVSDTLSELKCLVSDETLEDLKKLRGLLGHKHPNLSIGELLAIATKAALAQLDPAKEPKRLRRKATPAPEVKPQHEVTPEKSQREATPAREVTRYIPSQVKRDVWKKAHGRCALCQSVFRLQIDHIQPHALGGSNKRENLRLLCFHCNQREAVIRLGRVNVGKVRPPSMPPAPIAPRSGLAAPKSALAADRL